MNAQVRPTAVLWDAGNVILRWDPRTLYAKVFPDPAEREWFLANICTPAWNELNDLGGDMSGNVRALAERHPEHAEAILAWRSRWLEMFCGAIPETEAAIEALHARGAPQFGLSNMCAETEPETLALSPAFGRLSDIVISGREGMAKPDPRIFAIACARSGRRPDQLLFVDDSPVNIASAERLGFHTHLFEDPTALWPALQAHGLL